MTAQDIAGSMKRFPMLSIWGIIRSAFQAATATRRASNHCAKSANIELIRDIARMAEASMKGAEMQKATLRGRLFMTERLVR